MSHPHERRRPQRPPGRRRRPVALAMGLVALLLATLLQPATAQSDDPPFRDPSLPLEERVADLISRLELEEKVSLMHQWQPEIPRIDLPAFRTGTEALHGVAWLGEATVFPQAIGLGSTWDPELLTEIGQVVGTEARGFHHLDPDYHGLNLWAPVVDLLRDPRAGRNEEGLSEDAFHTGALSTAYAAGLQGDDETYLLAAPTLKHFIGYNNEVDRDTTNSSLPPRALHEYWLPAFEPALSAGAANAMMASYNFVNGRPAHLSPLINASREWSEDEILVVSDAFAPGNVVDVQQYYDDHAESHAALVNAGIDSFTDRAEDSSFTIGNITDALDQGLLTEADIDGALAHMLPIRFRLGDFDPPGLNPYEDITDEVINAPEHQELAHEAALAQNVLLANDDATLPLDDADGSVAVVGPLADTLYEDWYSGTMPYRVTVLDGVRDRLGEDRVPTSEGVDAIALQVAETGEWLTAPTDEAGGQLTADADSAGVDETMRLFDWGQGVYALRTEANGKYLSQSGDRSIRNDQVQPNGWEVRETFNIEEAEDGTVLLRNVQSQTYLAVDDDGGLVAGADADGATRFALETLLNGAEEAVDVAAEADTAVVVVGNNPYINGRETQDRDDIRLSPGQEDLLTAVSEANDNVIVVVMSSYPVALPDLPTVLWTSHAGQETGSALAEVLFGDVSPAGRLPQTWYRSSDDLPESILEYDIAQAGTTYQYFAGEPLYPFGHGLSYTEFDYSEPRLESSEVAPDGTVEIAVDVTNSGSQDSDEVVQIYTRTLDAPVDQPLQTLRDFERVAVPAGETETVTFSLDAADLAYWDVETDAEVVAPGSYEVLVGTSSQDIRAAVPLEVTGDIEPRERDLTAGQDAADFDSYQGVEIVDRSKVEGDSVAGGAGDWLAFHDVRMVEVTERSIELTAAREAEGDAAVEIRLGGPDGELLATVEVPSTGDRYAYEVSSAELAEVAPGVADLYLVPTDDVRLATVQIVEEPVDPEPTDPPTEEPTDPPTEEPTDPDDPSPSPDPTDDGTGEDGTGSGDGSGDDGTGDGHGSDGNGSDGDGTSDGSGEDGTGGDQGELPSTGVDGAPIALVALALLTAGGAALVLRRRTTA